jgi:hypothetical protein
MRRFALPSLTLAGLLSLSILGACGDDGGSTVEPDAAGPSNEGFPTPTAVTKANQEVNGTWTEIGDADWSCLNTPSDDQPSTQSIMLSGQIRDFQNSGTLVKNSTVTAFPGIMLNGNLGTTMSSAVTTGQNYTMTLATLPAGETRYGFRIDADRYLRTYLLNQYFDPALAVQDRNISAVSLTTSTAVLAFVGESFDSSKGILAGAFRDCAGHEVSNAVATVSSVSATATHLPGATTFYFGRTTGLPARHNVEPVMSQNGLFVVIKLAPQTTPAFIQIWGFKSQADLTAGTLSLLSELPSPIEANAIITGSFEPKRT